VPVGFWSGPGIGACITNSNEELRLVIMTSAGTSSLDFGIVVVTLVAMGFLSTSAAATNAIEGATALSVMAAADASRVQ
jgi:hypothetical protein